jgi:hypothetical protein
LGNLCTHRECRERLLALGFDRKVKALEASPDASVRKYVARIQGKIEKANASAANAAN